jgi:septum formation protein
VHLYLASTSPARLTTLRAAGLEPTVVPSDVDEDAAVAEAEAAQGPLSPADMVLLLARAKAEAVIDLVSTSSASDRSTSDALILGGDSAFVIDGEIFGKPHTHERATARWHAHRGRTGTLYSGHWLIRLHNGAATASAGAVATAEVTFSGDVTDAEIDAYVASGEPLTVAGAFTIDSLGAAFIEHIAGDPSTVIGVSVPTVRKLAAELGVFWPDLWSSKPGA